MVVELVMDKRDAGVVFPVWVSIWMVAMLVLALEDFFAEIAIPELAADPAWVR